MASTSNKPKITKSKSAAQTKSAQAIQTQHTPAQTDADTTRVVDTEKREYRVRKDLDPNMIVTVRNGFQGTLVYKSSRTNEKFVWENFGDEQEMDLQELKNARNASKKFFINNWFLIDDPEVLDYLGVSQYYKYALDFDGLNNLFELPPDEIRSTISNLPDGQKKSIAYRAKRLIADKVIDSIRVINALEDSLSIELVER